MGWPCCATENALSVRCVFHWQNPLCYGIFSTGTYIHSLSLSITLVFFVVHTLHAMEKGGETRAHTQRRVRAGMGEYICSDALRKADIGLHPNNYSLLPGPKRYANWFDIRRMADRDRRSLSLLLAPPPMLLFSLFIVWRVLASLSSISSFEKETEKTEERCSQVREYVWHW